MNKHSKAWIKALLQYGIGIGLLIYVVNANWDPKFNADGEEVSPGLKKLLQQTPDFAYMAAVVGILFACTAIQFFRWYLLVRALDLPFTLRNALRLGLVGLFYNSFLPGSVGGDLVKAYFIAREQPGRRAAAVATVVADRLVGLFGLILYSAAVGGGCWLAGDARIANNDLLKLIIRICAGLVGISVLGWIVLGFLAQKRADRFAHRLAGLPKIGNALAEVWYAVWMYRQKPKVIYAVIAMTAFVHTGFVLAFHLAVRVYPSGGPATLPEHFVVAPIGYIGQAFIPAPGGVGGGELFFGWLYSDVLKRPKGTGVVGRLVLRMVEWTFGFVGYLVFLRMRKELPAIQHEAEEKGFGLEDPPADQKQ